MNILLWILAFIFMFAAIFSALGFIASLVVGIFSFDIGGLLALLPMSLMSLIICIPSFFLMKLCYKGIKPKLVKKLNHLLNTDEYEIANATGLPINPSISGLIGDRNCFSFNVFFNLVKQGFSSKLTMVKINIDGKELAIWLDRSTSGTLATTTTSGYSTGNMIGNTYVGSSSAFSNTDYTTVDVGSVSLNKEQYLFLSKLPSCKKAVINFIGATGDIEKTVRINDYTKKCMGLMMEQSKILMKQGKKIYFE